MPQKGEKVFPVPVPEQADENLQKIMASTGLRQTDILRYAIIAALDTLAEKESVSLPIRFSTNGEHPKKK